MTSVLTMNARCRPVPVRNTARMLSAAAATAAYVLATAAAVNPARTRGRRCGWCGAPAQARTCSYQCRQQLSSYWQPGDC